MRLASRDSQLPSVRAQYAWPILWLCAVHSGAENSRALPSCGTQAPLIAVGLFGVYSVSALAYGLLTFRDCPEEAASLQQVCHRAVAAMAIICGIYHLDG